LAAQAQAVYQGDGGAFTLALPKDWRVVAESQEAHPVILGPENDTGAPSIVLSVHNAEGSLFDFSARALKDFEGLPNFAIERRDSFLTAGRAAGIKGRGQVAQSAGRLRATVLFCAGRKIALCADRHAARRKTFAIRGAT